MRPDVQTLQTTISTWPGVVASGHRFGGVEFTLSGIEVGHVHSDGMVDIPFNRKIRDQLLIEQRALPHHLLKDTGWITFYMRTEADLEKAIWLFRLSYLFYAGRGKNKTALKDVLDMQAEIDALQLSTGLRAALGSVETE